MSKQEITDIIDVDGTQVQVVNVRAISCEQKPKRGPNGQLYTNRVPTGALLATAQDGAMYWRETNDAPWEKC